MNSHKIKVIIGNDHAGTQLKKDIIEHFEYKFQFVNKGTDEETSVDYPDFANAVAHEVVLSGAVGILLCGSANGVCISANKHKGIRAGLAWNAEVAALIKQHNNANIVCIPARFVSKEEAFDIVEAFFNEKFEGGRHQMRIEKIID